MNNIHTNLYIELDKAIKRRDTNQINKITMMIHIVEKIMIDHPITKESNTITGKEHENTRRK